jgi:ABC-type polysaccharide/polyol phosphate export permease
VLARLLKEPPPYSAPDADEKRMLARWALWDIIEGLRLYEMWLRQSWNEVRRRYRRTLLGPMWVTVSLIIFAVMLSVVWAGLFNTPWRQFLPFLLSGLLPWTLLSSSIAEGCMALAAGEALMKARQFPYTTLVYMVLARNTIVLGHNLVGYFPIAIACGVPLGWQTALLVPGVFLLIANCGWMALLIAIVCLRFRDFQQMVISLLQIAVFITPIFWMANQLKGRRAMIVDYNPLHYMVDLVREPLLGNAPQPVSYYVCLATALVGWWIAFRLLASKRHRLAYWF